MTDFVYGIADVLQWTFTTILEPLGNMPNVIFTIGIIAGMAYWMFVVQPKYTRKAKKEGGLV